tara:strand:- start:910 stop:1431 length:522 start_codon:yes stop_codon:yes gene_type:complete
MPLKNNIKILSHLGATSETFVAPHIFVKYIGDNIKGKKWMKCNTYEREKYLSTLLEKFDWYPTLLYSDDNKKFLIFKYAGVPLNIKNMPCDFEHQFNKILNDLKDINVQHNDIKHGEILVDNNKIYLCDFGWGSVNGNMNCGIDIWGCINTKKPGGWQNDATTLERLNLVKKK